MTLNLDDLEALYLNDKERPTGTIGRDHVLALIANLREAEQGETEWEYGSEGAEGTEDPDPRPLADDNAYWPESLEGVREPNAEQAAQIVAKWNEGDPGSARLIRRRKAGPWLPVPGSTVRESDSGVRDPDSEGKETK